MTPTAIWRRSRVSIALTTTTSALIGAGTYVSPHIAVIHRLPLVATSSTPCAWAAYSAATGSLHRPHDNHVRSPGCLLDLATYFLNPTGFSSQRSKPDKQKRRLSQSVSPSHHPRDRCSVRSREQPSGLGIHPRRRLGATYGSSQSRSGRATSLAFLYAQSSGSDVAAV